MQFIPYVVVLDTEIIFGERNGDSTKMTLNLLKKRWRRFALDHIWHLCMLS
jgi:hypothetical protein